MLQTCIAEHAKLKMETAHHKLQYNLLSMQADEDAKRAVVEHEMTRREVEALRTAEHSRQARRDLNAASDSTHSKYLQLKMWYEEMAEENESLRKRLKLAKKVIQQKEEETMSLTDEKELLLNRLRENREHFHLLCSPGGIFHGALTPKSYSVATPGPPRGSPRHTPKSAQREIRHDRTHSHQPMAALLQALSQENNSAPSTPTTAERPPPRVTLKHVRNVQSMPSLPTTPTSRPQGEPAGLLPPVDLSSQSDSQHRFIKYVPEKPHMVWELAPRSRESTISEEDNEELARQALEAAHAQTSFTSRYSHGSRSSRGPRPHPSNEAIEEEVYESQASQAASEMLRRDPRESFEVASSAGASRDGTPAPAEKSAKLQAKIFAGLNKSGMGGDKRKFSAGTEASDETQRDTFTSPTKKARVGSSLQEGSRRVGLGIQYSQEA